jgi:hypothetical protein
VKNKLYDFNDKCFRFTSRFISTIVVGLVALYYFFLLLFYSIGINMSYLLSVVPDDLNSQVLMLENLLNNNETGLVNIGEILCNINEAICIESLQEMGGSIRLPFVHKAINILFDIKSSLMAVALVPIFIALLICLVQVFLLVRETKTCLNELYKGKCDYVSKAEKLSNASIAASSFHFGGYTFLKKLKKDPFFSLKNSQN